MKTSSSLFSRCLPIHQAACLASAARPQSCRSICGGWALQTSVRNALPSAASALTQTQHTSTALGRRSFCRWAPTQAPARKFPCFIQPPSPTLPLLISFPLCRSTMCHSLNISELTENLSSFCNEQLKNLSCHCTSPASCNQLQCYGQHSPHPHLLCPQ